MVLFIKAVHACVLSLFLTVMSLPLSGFSFSFNGAVAFPHPLPLILQLGCSPVESALCCWQHAALMSEWSFPVSFSLQVVRESGGVLEVVLPTSLTFLSGFPSSPSLVLLLAVVQWTDMNCCILMFRLVLTWSI